MKPLIESVASKSPTLLLPARSTKPELVVCRISSDLAPIWFRPGRSVIELSGSGGALTSGDGRGDGTRDGTLLELLGRAGLGSKFCKFKSPALSITDIEASSSSKAAALTIISCSLHMPHAIGGLHAKTAAIDHSQPLV